MDCLSTSEETEYCRLVESCRSNNIVGSHLNFLLLITIHENGLTGSRCRFGGRGRGDKRGRVSERWREREEREVARLQVKGVFDQNNISTV